MRLGATILVGLVGVVGAVLLIVPGALGFAMWLSGLTAMGLVAATTLTIVEDVAALAGSVIPVSVVAWATGRHPASPTEALALQRSRKLRALGVELAIRAGVAGVLVATARWWAPPLHVPPLPWWIPVAVCVRHAARQSLSASSHLGHRARWPLATTLMLVDAIFVFGVIARLRGDLGFVAVGSAVVTLGLALLAVVVCPGPPSPAMRAQLGPRAVVPPGAYVLSPAAWIAQAPTRALRIYLVILVGPAMVLPYLATNMIGAMLMVPFVMTALLDVPRLPWRVARGVALALGFFALCHQLGPPLVRWAVPAALAGQASLLRVVAWSGLALLLLSLWRPGRRPRAGWRAAVATVVGCVAMLVLGAWYGLVGLAWATNIEFVTSVVLGVCERPTPASLTGG